MRVGSLCIGTMTLFALALLRGNKLAIRDRRVWGHIFVASQFNIVSFSIFTPFAQLSSSTSRVAIVVYTMPIWASILARPVLGERLTRARFIGLMLCTAGMAILIYPLATMGIPIGILLALGGAVSWAAGTVYLKWAQINADPTAVTFWQLVVGVVVVTAVLPFAEGSLHLAQASRQAILALIFAGTVGSGLAYFLWFDAVRRLPTMTASLGVLGVPVVGVVSSIWLLGEWPTVADILGFGLMLAASACVLLQPHDVPRIRPEP
jgi:drug/metabolite transporter (DMT)-like permease